MNNHNTGRRLLLLIAPCLVTVTLIVIYFFVPLRPFDMPSLITNIFFLLCITPELAAAFTAEENRWKALGFTASSAIGAAAALFNIVGEAANGAFSWRNLSIESWLWLGLLLLSVVSLAVVLWRMRLWDQEHWEQYRQWRQEYKEERNQQRREARRERSKEKQENRLEQLKKKDGAALTAQQVRIDNKADIRKAKHEELKRRISEGKTIGAWLAKHLGNLIMILGSLATLLGYIFSEEFRAFLGRLFGSSSSGENVGWSIGKAAFVIILTAVVIWLLVRLFKFFVRKSLAEWLKENKHIVAFIVVLVIAILFFAIPSFEQLRHIAYSWLEAVSELSRQINILHYDEEKAGIILRFANYLIFFIILIVSILFLFLLGKYIMFNVILPLFNGKVPPTKQEEIGFLLHYETPIAVFTVCLCVLFAIAGSTNDAQSIVELAENNNNTQKIINQVEQTVGNSVTLIGAVLLLLTAFASVELVRIVIEQVGKKDSLLKRLIWLHFVSVLDVFFDILLSVIATLKLVLGVTSIPELIIPEEWLSIKNKIRKMADKLFCHALNRDAQSDSSRSKQPGFSKKTIWRRHRRK